MGVIADKLYGAGGILEAIWRRREGWCDTLQQESCSSGRDGQEKAEPRMKIQRKREAEENDWSRTGGEVSQLNKSNEGSGDVGTCRVI